MLVALFAFLGSRLLTGEEGVVTSFRLAGPGHNGHVTRIVPISGGFVSFGQDKTVQFWADKTLRNTGILRYPIVPGVGGSPIDACRADDKLYFAVHALQINRGNGRIYEASVSDRVLTGRFWDTPVGEQITKLAVSKDGGALAFLTVNNGKGKLWLQKTVGEEPRSVVVAGQDLYGLAWLGSDVACTTVNPGSGKGTVSVYGSNDLKLKWQAETPQGASQCYVDRSGRMVLCGFQGWVQTFLPGKRSGQAVELSHSDPITDFDVSEAGDVAYSMLPNTPTFENEVAVMVADPLSGKSRKLGMAKGTPWEVSWVEGDSVAIGSETSDITLFRADESSATVSAQSSYPMGVRLTENGKQVAWNIGTGDTRRAVNLNLDQAKVVVGDKPLADHDSHTVGDKSLVMTKERLTLQSGGKTIAEMKGVPGSSGEGDIGPFAGSAYALFGGTVACATSSNIILVKDDLQTWIATLVGCDGTITSIDGARRSDGKFVVAASCTDGTVRVWVLGEKQAALRRVAPALTVWLTPDGLDYLAWNDSTGFFATGAQGYRHFLVQRQEANNPNVWTNNLEAGRDTLQNIKEVSSLVASGDNSDSQAEGTKKIGDAARLRFLGIQEVVGQKATTLQPDSSGGSAQKLGYRTKASTVQVVLQRADKDVQVNDAFVCSVKGLEFDPVYDDDTNYVSVRFKLFPGLNQIVLTGTSPAGETKLEPILVFCEAQEATGSLKSLCVGVSEYDSLKPLPFVKNDIPSLQPYFDRVKAAGIQTEVDIVQTASQTTKASLEKKLSEFLKPERFERNDTLIVYWSSHGTVLDGDATHGSEKSKLSFFFVPSDGKSGNSDSLVSFETVLTAMRRVQCRNKLLILDNCYSGAAALQSIQTAGSDMIDVYASSSYDESSYPLPDDREPTKPEKGKSLFTWALAGALTDSKEVYGDSPPTRDLTLRDIAAYVNVAVQRKADTLRAIAEKAQVPGIKDFSQHPTYLGLRGDMTLVWRKNGGSKQ